MTANVWEVAGAVCKLFSLLAMAGITGGGFSLWLAQRMGFARQSQLFAYLLVSALAGLFSTLLFFLVQVGAINQNGLPGMLDQSMVAIVAQSSLGSATAWRLVGFGAVLPAWYLLQRYASTSSGMNYGKSGFVILIAAILCASYSFAMSGHTSTLLPIARLIIILHVVAVFLWIGSLYPLLILANNPDITRVRRLMRAFGATAMLIVATLLISGTTLLTLLLHSFGELVTTPYGRTMLLKLAGVGCLLGLAAINKLLLVPGLGSTATVAPLRTSIKMELAVASFVLLITVYLTTAVGPHES